MLTYNALSMRGIVEQALIEQMLVANEVGVAGFQETRDMADDITETAKHRKFHAAGEAGNFGCQLRVRKDTACRMETLAVRRCSPRLMRVLGNYGNVRCAMIVGHSPHSKQSDSVVEHFWKRFRNLLATIGASISPLVMIDGNARFDEDANGQRRPSNRNAVHLQQRLLDSGLEMTRMKDCYGRPVITWQSPMKQKAKMDYMLVPGEWAPRFRTKGLPVHVDSMLLEWDHCGL